MAIERELHEARHPGDPARGVRAWPASAGLVSPLPRRPVDGPLQLQPNSRVLVLPDVPVAPGQAASLLPLLALWLAHEGLPVLVHRPGALEGPASAASVLGSLGIAPACGASDVADRWARREPAVMATGRITPAGGAAPWTLATPRGPRQVLHVVHCDNPATEQQAAAWAAAGGGAAAMLLAGPFGIDAHHAPRVEVWLDGQRQPSLGAAAADEPPAQRAPMPRDASAAAAAVFAQQVLSGERPAPGPVQALARRIIALWACLR